MLVRLALLAVVALSAAMGGRAFPAQESAVGDAPSYRLLFSYHSNPEEKFRFIHYWVRVEEPLSEKEFKRVVCSVIRQETPAPADYLSVRVHLRLDSYHLVETPESNETFLGSYLWNRDLPGNRRRLVRYRDEHRLPLPYEARFSEFDHVRDCPRILK